MKMRFAIISLLALSFHHANCQKLIKGYIVTLANDTEIVKMRIPTDPQSIKGELDLTQGIEIVRKDSSQIAGPSDIKSYGFTYRGHEYVRVSKAISDYRKLFLVPECVGNKANLYSFTSMGVYFELSGVRKNDGVLPPAPVVGSQVRNTCYTIEKADGHKMFASKYANTTDLKEMLKRFFSDSPETQAEIDKKVMGISSAVNTWKAIKGIVSAYNQRGELIK